MHDPLQTGWSTDVEFNLGVRFASDHVSLRVRGEVDALTAPALGAALRALVDQGAAGVVLDLAELEFIDVSGLDVIADISERLAAAGRALTVSGASPMLRRMVEITGMNDLVDLDASGDIANGPGRQRSAENLVHRGTRSDNTVIDAALRLVTVLAEGTVEGADGVSVTLERQGRMTTVASSNDTVLRMDDHQYTTGEGPCLAAASHGHRYLIDSLANESRWPAFVPLAMEEGIASILSTPLMSADRPVGALNIYSNAERAFGSRQQELAAFFASQASAVVADATASVIDERMTERIADALLAREVIAQAQGVLISRHGVTTHQSAVALYGAARTAGTTVRDHARSVVASAHEDNPGRDETPS